VVSGWHLEDQATPCTGHVATRLADDRGCTPAAGTAARKRAAHRLPPAAQDEALLAAAPAAGAGCVEAIP
jgi:hypothetical protein